jgi:hypothetical protein
MLLNFPNKDPFATGALRYSYSPVPGRDDVTPRIMIEVEIEGEQEAAVLDTGAPYLVCSPALAERLWLDPEDALEATTIRIQGVPIRGLIYRTNFVLHAREGNGLDFQATAFVPDTDQSLPTNLLPVTFLGLHGCLERVRFAVDPSSETFYFGRHP